MKRIRFGVPGKQVPSLYCKGFSYREGEIGFDLSSLSFSVNARGCVLRFPLSADEHIYGFGLQLKGFDQKGKKLTLRTNADPVKPTGDTHAPVPFFISTKGYGIYLDTARYVEYYIGAAPAAAKSGKQDAYRLYDNEADLYAPKENNGDSEMAIQIPAARGVDAYIIEGDSITDIVSQYNMLAGGGPEVPEWGLGLLYRCHLKYTDKKVLEMADYFRSHDIPCDILGLEPGWQTHAYSCTYVWDRDRYPGLEEMLKTLREKGFHLSLWEHAFTHPTSPLYEEIKKGCGDYKVWEGLVPDFGDPAIRTAFADYHKKNVAISPVDGFKLDECDSSDMTGSWSFPNLAEFPSGMDGEQYHSLFGTLYMQTMMEALDYRPTLSQVRQAGALAAPYPFVLYSDLYDHKDFIRGCVNAGFSGLLWAPELRHAASKADLLRRLETVVFSPQCLINAWYCEEVPWKEYDCESEVRELIKLRESLKPMLKAAFDAYHTHGIPPVRALVSDYTKDAETYEIDDEYLFCRELLVAPMTAEESEREVYLPTDDQWEDFFTGEAVGNGHIRLTSGRIGVYRKK